MKKRFVNLVAVLTLALALILAPRWDDANADVNVGVYSLISTQITNAISGQAQTAIGSLDGQTAVTLVANFAYGSGGSTASVIIQTTLDGTNWYDVARFDFTTASRVASANLSGLTARASGTYTALASEGVNDALLGNQLRAVLTTTGTYATTSLSVVASIR